MQNRYVRQYNHSIYLIRSMFTTLSVRTEQMIYSAGFVFFFFSRLFLSSGSRHRRGEAMKKKPFLRLVQTANCNLFLFTFLRMFFCERQTIPIVSFNFPLSGYNFGLHFASFSLTIVVAPFLVYSPRDLFELNFNKIDHVRDDVGVVMRCGLQDKVYMQIPCFHYPTECRKKEREEKLC